MNPEVAAQILHELADSREAILGDVSAMGWDDRSAAMASGDVEIIKALRLGADSLTMMSLRSHDAESD